MEELIGSVNQDEFVRGLLQASSKNSLGEVWEKCVICQYCLYAKQCQKLSTVLEELGKNPSCGQIVDILLGTLSPDDASIPDLPYYNK